MNMIMLKMLAQLQQKGAVKNGTVFNPIFSQPPDLSLKLFNCY